jgi:hypothetical protein
MAVAVLLALVSGLFAPVHADDEPASTSTTVNTFELRDAAAMRKAGRTGEGVIGTQVVPGATTTTKMRTPLSGVLLAWASSRRTLGP